MRRCKENGKTLFDGQSLVWFSKLELFGFPAFRRIWTIPSCHGVVRGTSSEFQVMSLILSIKKGLRFVTFFSVAKLFSWESGPWHPKMSSLWPITICGRCCRGSAIYVMDGIGWMCWIIIPTPRPGCRSANNLCWWDSAPDCWPPQRACPDREGREAAALWPAAHRLLKCNDTQI